MGLAICKRIVHLMGGQIFIESQVGLGTTISFTAKLKIIYSYKRYLDAFGFQTTPAGSGEKALDIIKNKKFGLVITGYKLPGIDGIETVKQIKALSPEIIPTIISIALKA